MDAATQRAMAGFGAASPDGPAGLAVRGYLAEQTRAFLTHSTLPMRPSAAARLRAACLRAATALAACRAAADPLAGLSAGPLVDPLWAEELSRELDATAEVLGAERDADAVRPRLLAALDAWIAEGRHPDGGAARTRTLLTRMLDRERSAAHAQATAALVGPAFHALADRMATAARDVPLTPAAERPCRQVLPELAEAAYREFETRVEDLPEPLAAENAAGDAAWLAAERAGRTALFTAELCRPAGTLLTGDDAADPPPRPARLAQAAEALAEQRDAVLAAACVHRAADTPRIAATTGYVLGRLHEEQRLAVLRARSTARLPVREGSAYQ